ncbi:MAG TPA: AmmeMemoRadiSam system protein A [Candidatus Saccharimonadales bacterium]|nr:AmmeMemoRadiSam system protein A [Candidatus Saccharimonadales bacterium]
MQEKLTIEEQQILLRLAREAMEDGVKGEALSPLDESSLPSKLREEGSSFITLTAGGELRGCIGSLEPHQSLVEDVREHAIAAALKDPRFPPVQEEELNGIKIEVSCLTRPIPLEYSNAEDLLSKLCPHVDGVVVRDGTYHRATFLPQVWAKISDPAEFLCNLCFKMGVDPNLWRMKHLDVLTYQVEEFHE